MCERAGVDAVWVSDHRVPAEGGPRLEAWTALTLAGLDTSRVRLGVMLDSALRPPALLAALAATLDAARGGRLELGFSAGPGDVVEYVTSVRKLLARDHVDRTGADGPREPGPAVASARPDGPALSLEVRGAVTVAAALTVADDIVVPAAPMSDLRASVARIRWECAAAGRDPGSLGVAVELPVSIGRTSAEARARASVDARFQAIGHPSTAGIFGTLEQGQDRVIELAHAGITDLRCVLPDVPDVGDVIAQLTAMVVGTVDVLIPNSPRSKAPDPPAGWGGRPSRH